MILLQGILIGIAVAAPVGPMGLLCINKTLSKGQGEGMVAGLGIAAGDFVYACVAVFLYSFVAVFLNQYKILFTTIGSIVLILLGVSFVFKKPQDDLAKGNAAGTFLKTFLLTLSNPATILSFVAVAASVATVHGWVLVCGIFFGSLLWWLLLTTTVSFFRHTVSIKTIQKINTLSGIVIIILGVLNILKIL